MADQGRADEQQISQEIQLVEFLERLSRNRDGRVAIHVHLSRLRPWQRREQHLRLATSTFADLVRPLQGQGFVLRNSDIVFVGHSKDIEALTDAVERLRGMFSEDQAGPVADVSVTDDFCSWINLTTRFDEFMAWARQTGDAERARQRRLAAARAHLNATPQKPINPAQLTRIEAYLSQADLSGLMRRQPICLIAPDQSIKPVYRELYIAISSLAAAVSPDIDLAGNKWLFRHLTQVLDQRMLSLLARNDDRDIASAFSLNLNVATIATPHFLAFDRTIGSNARGTIVIEFDLIDIMADMSGFQFAREVLRDRGYRICVDGADHQTLPMIDRERLGADLLKLMWRPEMAEGTNPALASDLRQCIQRAGLARVILNRCGEAAAVAFGQSLGITLFQGRQVDTMLAEQGRRGGPVAQPARARAS
ncbi:MAG: hypothetical protein L6R19_19155 [Alphaproteobacteria bacterium]|nr:hypothetical protein [Alphaproteobacteria bacterium]